MRGQYIFATIAIPAIAGALANGVLNWMQKHDVARSFLHGLVTAFITAATTEVAYLIFGGAK